MLLCPVCESAYREPLATCPADGAGLRPAVELDSRLSGQIANYRLVDLLGKGGMGVVYLGEHIYIGKPAAIKVLHEKYAAQHEAVARFLQEARAAATIGHPNIADVSDFGETADGCAYFVMEFIEGKPLDQIIGEEGPLSLLRTINIINQVGRALGAAHDKGIVHRDLKPENVMLTSKPGRREVVRAAADAGARQFSVEPEGEYDFVKILDFGVAKMNDSAVSLGKTSAGVLLGTPEYMSPEAARGTTVDLRADIYAIGVLCYEMLTSTVPFEGQNPVEILIGHISRQPPPMRDKAPKADVTPAIEQLIAQCLAKDPDQRPQSMDAFLSALQKCYGDDETYRRHVDRMPGAQEAGIRAPAHRLTEDLRELVAELKAQDPQAVVRSLMNEPVLLTQKKGDPSPGDSTRTLLGVGGMSDVTKTRRR
jgi:serine/threonine-protein kinase